MPWLLLGLGALFLLSQLGKGGAQRTPEQQMGVTAASVFMLADVRAGHAKEVAGLPVTVAQAEASNNPAMLRSTAATLAQLGYSMTAQALQIKADRIATGDNATADAKMAQLGELVRQYLPEFPAATA